MIKEIIKRGLQMVFGHFIFDAPGLIQIRLAILKCFFSVGKKCIIAHNVIFTQPDGLKGGKLVLGNRVEISPHVEIDYSGCIIIEEDVWISQGVIVETHSHEVRTKSLKYDHSIMTSPLIIKKDAWLGARAFISPKVNYIGIGAVIGAGAIVTKNVPDWAIVAGVPATIIGYRE